MYQKTMPVRVKAAADDQGEGIVEALVATYDLDSAGERIVPGAFAKTLDEWGARDESIPFLWSHMHDDLDAYLGDVIEASETDDGLLVKAQIDLDDEKSRKAYKLIKGGRVRNYSFAYEVIDSEEKSDELLLKELKLFEVGPTLIGMNQATRTVAVKRSRKAADDEPVDELDEPEDDDARIDVASITTSLREASEAISQALAQLDSKPDEEPSDEEPSEAGDSTQPAEPEKADESAKTKADEPTPTGPALDDLLLEVQLLTQKGI